MLKRALDRIRGKALTLGVATVLVGGGIAAAATDIAATNQEAAEEKAAAAEAHSEDVGEAIATYTGQLDEWTSCVAENAASRGDTQSDPETRSDEPFDPKDGCEDKPVLELPEPPTEESNDDNGAADGPPPEVEAFLVELEAWVGCVQDAAAAHADQQSNEETRVEGDDFEAADQCDPKPTNPNDDADEGENGDVPADAGRPDDAGPPADAGRPDDAGPPADAGSDN